MSDSHFSKNRQCGSCTVYNCLISMHCSSERHKEINKYKSCSYYKTGQRIIIEGFNVYGIYFILSGKVKVYKESHNNKEHIVHLAKSGDILGHIGYGCEFVYPISAVALENVVVCFIPQIRFFELLETNFKITFHLAMIYADELRRVEKRLRNMTIMNARAKVVDALLFITKAFLDKQKDGEEFELLLSRKEIGEITGTSGEQVSREMSALKNNGLIDIKGRGRIIIKSYKKLHDIVRQYNPTYY